MEEHKKKKGSGGFAYTGKLRSVMPVEPVPKREVPDHIVKPDYATEGASLPLPAHGPVHSAQSQLFEQGVVTLR